MLKKLFKYDWKSVSLILFILHGGLLIYSLIGRIGTETFMRNNSSQAAEITTVFYLIVYVFGMFVVGLATFFYLAMRIQKSLFSDEGYLTHTLPVTPTQLLLSKIFVFWLWCIIDITCLVISLSILLINGSVWDDLCYLARYILDIFTKDSGMTTLLSVILFLLAAIAEYFFYYTGLLMLSLCLGGQFKNHKILGAVVSYSGITVAVSFLNLLVLYFLLPDSRMYSVTGFLIGTNTPYMFTNNLFIYCIIFYTVLGIAGFMGSRYILSKKLNLE